MKKCAKCHKNKTVDQFSKNQRYCKACKKAYYAASREKRIAQTMASKRRNAMKLLAVKYGVTEEAMLCESCHKRPGTHVDHDHNTGKLRGNLCNNCNAGIGMLGDTLEGVLAAAEYLRGA